MRARRRPSSRRIARRLAPVLALAVSAALPADAAEIALLQGLDKTTARISKFEAPVNEPVVFGSLSITVLACKKRPPEEPPESAAFLTVDDKRPGASEAVRVFSGWMFASSPALSAMEHAVYDIGVLDCRADPPKGPPQGPAKQSPAGPSPAPARR